MVLDDPVQSDIAGDGDDQENCKRYPAYRQEEEQSQPKQRRFVEPVGFRWENRVEKCAGQKNQPQGRYEQLPESDFSEVHRGLMNQAPGSSSVLGVLQVTKTVRISR